MRLESMWVHGLRRFGGEDPLRLRIDGPLVCLIGANEVGKSTLLDGLEMADGARDEEGNWIPVDPSQWTRGETLPEDRSIVRLRYRLDDAERRQLRALEAGKRLRDVRWLECRRLVDGRVLTTLDPVPTRDKDPRHALGARLTEELEDPDGVLGARSDDTPTAPETVKALAKALSANNMYINDAQLSNLRALGDHLEAEERDGKLVADIRDVLEREEEKHPLDQALEVLKPLVPRFVRFELAARQVADEYELTSAAHDPPPPLHNLAELAQLDLEVLLEQIQTGLTGSAYDTIEKANAVLAEEFSAWTQKPPVRVSFDRSGTQLLVHVQSGSGASMKPQERSEGLRQFVALVALTAGEGHSVPPILLIDETEMHLHYDAQADLMEVLSKQTAAAQVIYTTHSAACLPEDLGSSVRVVRGIKDQMRSYVDQQFWTDDPGLVPLLLAMGAGSLAFVPLRPAVIVEGGSDLVLLPSLLKEATRTRRLGYQVVPGAAGTPPTRVAGLDLHGISTAWVLDGDQGGVERRRFLGKHGVPKARVHLLKAGSEGLDLEDLIDPETYVKAVNNYAADVGADETFTLARLPSKTCRRHKAVTAWFKKQKLDEPGKTAIANKVLEMRGEARLGDPRRQATLREIHRTLRRQLKVRNTARRSSVAGS